MAMKVMVWQGEESIASALERIGLDESTLLAAVKAGLEARSLCTLNHPPGYRGLSGWAETVRALRERKTADGWKRDNRRNLATIVNPEGWLSIAVATGDAETGLLKDDAMPRTKYEKGPSVIAAVKENQLAFAFIPADRRAQIETDTPRMTWMLLIYWGEEEVRAELSLPSSVDADGYVNGWAGRILLSAFRVEPQPPQLEDQGDEIDVLVERKK